MLTSAPTQSKVAAPYVTDMVKALAPGMNGLAEVYLAAKANAATSAVEVADRLILLKQHVAALQGGISNLLKSRTLSAELLEEGGNDPEMIRLGQRQAGSWIKDTAELVSVVEKKVVTAFKEESQEQRQKMLSDLVGNDTPDAGTVPRLLRSLYISSLFTGKELHLGATRSELGLSEHFASSAFREVAARRSSSVG